MRVSIFSYHKKLFYVFLFFLPVQLNYYFWPDWAYVLGRQVDYLSPILYATDIVLVIMLSCWALEQKKLWLTLKNSMAMRVFLPLCLLVFVNIFFSSVPIVSAFKWLVVIKLSFLSVYIIKNNFSILQVTIPLLLSSFGVSGIGILQVLKQQSVGFYWLGERSFDNQTLNIAKFFFCYPFEVSSACWQTIRAYGTFAHPNVFGGFLALVLLMTIKQKKLLVAWLKTSQLYSLLPNEKVMFLSVLSLPLMALLLTFSRTAWISFIVGLVFMSSLSQTKKSIVGLLIAGTMIFSTLPFSLIQVSNTESFLVRRQLNEAAFSIIADYWLTGVGLGNFLTVLPEYLVSRSIYFLQPVHNIYVLFLSEFGLFGVLIIILLMQHFLYSMKRILTEHSYVFIPIILIGITDHYFYSLHQGQLLLTVVLSSFYILNKHA